MAQDGILAGQVAIVTAGANGLGEGCALVLARHGAAVVIADIDTENGEQLVGLIVKLGLSMLTRIDRILIGMPPMMLGTVSEAAVTCAVFGSTRSATRTTTTP